MAKKRQRKSSKKPQSMLLMPRGLYLTLDSKTHADLKKALKAGRVIKCKLDEMVMIELPGGHVTQATPIRDVRISGTPIRDVRVKGKRRQKKK